MRVRLSNGEILDTKPSTPSKRSVKQKGGSLKRWHSQQINRSVGGRNSIASATYSDFIEGPNGEVVINRSLSVVLCHVVDPRKCSFTWDLGGSTPNPYQGGKGL